LKKKTKVSGAIGVKNDWCIGTPSFLKWGIKIDDKRRRELLNYVFKTKEDDKVYDEEEKKN